MATSRQRQISWSLGVAVFIVSALIIFHRLGFGSIWRDEAFSVELAKQSWGTMLHVVLTVEGNMFFYYLVMHLWLGLLHIFHIRWSAYWVRVPNALGYVGAALAIWRLADYLTGRAGGLIAVMVWWAFPWNTIYGQQARSFSFLFFFTALSFYSMIRWVDAQTPQERQRWAIIYSIATVLDVYSFLDSVFYIVTQALIMTWLWRRRRIETPGYMRYWAVVVGAAIVCLPLVPSILHGGQVGWVPLQSIHDMIAYPTTWLIKSKHAIITLFIVVGVILGIVVGLLPMKNDPTQANRRRAVGLGLTWAILPLIMEYLVSHYLHFHILDAVYALPTTLGIALATAAGWTAIGRAPVAWAAMAVALILGFPQWHRGQGVSLEQWRDPVLAWAKDVKPHQPIVLINNIGGIQYTVQYFIDAHHLPIVIAPYPGQFTWSEYVHLKAKGAYFAEAESVKDLQKAGILRPHRKVWFAYADVSSADVASLQSWLAHHAVQEKQVANPHWPVSFHLYDIR